jgi:Raf kinase inhibitor-like YbhB/YbcL family protein
VRYGYLAAAAVLALIAAGLAWVFWPKSGGASGLLVDRRFEELVSGAPQSLTVEADGIRGGSRFPVEYTCDGADRAPSVVVSGIPEGAAAVALVMYDPDAPLGTFIHWLAVEKPGGGRAVFPSPAAVEGRNDFGRIGYGGPCPPRGHGEHRYFLLALALDRDPGLGRGFRLGDLLAAARGNVVAWGYTMGTYSR